MISYTGCLHTSTNRTLCGMGVSLNWTLSTWGFICSSPGDSEHTSTTLHCRDRAKRICRAFRLSSQREKILSYSHLEKHYSKASATLPTATSNQWQMSPPQLLCSSMETEGWACNTHHVVTGGTSADSEAKQTEIKACLETE